MLLLDENLPEGQRLLLREWRLHFRTVGVELASSGALDENLIVLLHRLPQPTFFSLDRHFYRADWLHSNYCLVWLDVRRNMTATTIRRFIRDSHFDTQAKRLGVVARVHAAGVHFWQTGVRRLQVVIWPET